MAMRVERASTGASPNRSASVGHAIGLAVAALVAAAAIGAAVLGWPGGVRNQLGWLMLALVWLTAAFGIRASRAHTRARRGAARARTLTIALAIALATEVVVAA